MGKKENRRLQINTKKKKKYYKYTTYKIKKKKKKKKKNKKKKKKLLISWGAKKRPLQIQLTQIQRKILLPFTILIKHLYLF